MREESQCVSLADFSLYHTSFIEGTNEGLRQPLVGVSN